MPNIRTIRVDRRLISLLTREPQLIRYLENLGLDVQETIPGAIDDNTEELLVVQLAADSAHGSANAALQAVHELSDIVAGLELQNPPGLHAIRAAVQEIEGSIIELMASAASGATLQAALRRIDELEGSMLEPSRPQAFQLDAWTAPTLLNSWVNYGTPFNPAGYWKDPFGVVHLRGIVKSGTIGQAIFNLPVGYRPANTELMTTYSNGIGGVALNVTNAGDVVAGSGSTVSYSIDGATFRAAA